MNLKELYPIVIKKLKSELSPKMFYHSVDHTLDVYCATNRIAKSENLDENELIILKTAALFHDIGLIKKYKDHEDVSAEIAREFLPEYDYSPDEIDLISSIIMKTKLPQSAENKLEKILCDADLDYLGRSDFYMISHKLRHEWEELGFWHSSLKEWYQLQVKFLSEHQYYTKTAIDLRQNGKLKNIQEIKNLLNF